MPTPKLIPAIAPATIGIPAGAVVRMAMRAAAATADPRVVVMRMTGLGWIGEGEAKRKRNIGN